MKVLTKIGLSILLFIGFLAALPTSVNAQSISYRSLKYGTNQNSMATGYFVRPATVIVRNHEYYVTMQIKTAKSLSAFPVKVDWVDGQRPKNVRKIKDAAGNSHLYYSFYTTNLKKRINAKLAIDVPKVYKAHHLITFKFNSANLPSLKVNQKKHHAAAVTNSTMPTKASQSSHSKPAVAQMKTTPTKASSINASTDKQPSKTKTKKDPKKKVTAKKPKSNQSSQPATASSTNKTTPNKAKWGHQSANDGRWIVGGVVVVAAISTGAWIYLRH